MNRKGYVIAPYMNGIAMYEIGDFRLDNMSKREMTNGTFKRDKSIKGWQNGHEIGIFTAKNNKKYVVFKDFSAKQWEEK